MEVVMRHPESADNWGYVCDIHAPQPDPRYAQMDPAAFLGRYVKRAFAVRASAAQEHMWVQVQTVTPDGHLQGVLDNDPVQDTGYVCGDTVTVTLAQIEAVL
jgi:Uncharacterized protein conserved in bacteria (DUF2314)